ncbi:DUF4158 domain-containing protein [Pseudovibrio sp. POLY-S9]|uniref:DUF4158 domain-containing protein n=1 Tax=Pseudovibrio sp. POLY-S9 TaxID=1576596 RepID=UPI000709C1DD|nr:DUF4158 domain-containing protein [Pseudovibrio sp. POLY-S9]
MDHIAARDWSLSFQDLEFLSSLSLSVCLEAAFQICSVRNAGRFIEDWTGLDEETVEYVASQLDMQPVHPHRSYSDRTARRYRLEIARYLGLTRTQAGHRAELEVWLRDVLCPNGGTMGDMLEQSFYWFQERRLLPPAEGILTRFIRTARKTFTDDILKNITNSLTDETVAALETCLANPRGDHGFQRLKDDVGAATLDNVLDGANRLAFIQKLTLPLVSISSIDLSWIKVLTRRVEGETASEMRRHSRDKRLGLLAIYLISRRWPNEYIAPIVAKI